MSEKHTPGPWRVAYFDSSGQSVVSGEHAEIATCWHHCVASIEEEMRANARLIAAAPELLEALKAICDEQDANEGYAAPATYDAARAAIAKAKEAQQ